MNKKIKILIAEHEPHDLELLHHELKSGGISYEYKEVQTEQNFIHALNNYIPDIILCDFTFPTFNGPAAFEIKQRITPATPFILVSGAIGEENSIELIKNGVTDFVLKDRMFTLCTKLTRAVKETKQLKQKLQTEKDLVISEARLSQAQAIAKLGSWETDLITMEVLWSRQTFRIFELEPENYKLSHPSFLQYVHPSDRQKVDAAFKNSLENFTENGIVHRIVTPFGNIKFVEECWHIFRDEAGKPLRAFGTCQDITERVRAEELKHQSEAKYRTMVESSMDAILFTVTDDEIVSANAAACEIFRMTEAEICEAGREGLIDITDPRLKTLLAERNKTGKAKGELVFKRKDGSRFPGEITSVVFKDIYDVERTSMVIRDITERLQTAEKLANTSAELTQALYDLNKVMDASLDVICTVDEHGSFVKVSAACELVWGYRPDELIGEPIINFIYPEDHKKTLAKSAHVMAGNNNHYFENRYVRKDGSLVNMEWSSRWDKTARLRYGVARDVTEKKRLKKTLETERLRFVELFRQAPSCIGVLIGPDHVFQMANPLYLELTGRTDVIGKPIREVFPEEKSHAFIALLDKIYATGEIFSGSEILLKLAKDDGTKIEAYANFIYQPFKNADNEVEGIFFFANDVTEQVLSRKKIEESERRLKEAQAISHIGNWEIDLLTSDHYWSEEIYELFGINKGDATPSRDAFMSFCHPEDLHDTYVIINEGLNTFQNMSFYFRFIRADGELRYSFNQWKYKFDANGNPVYLSGIFQDVTERKLAEAALRQSELRFRAFFDNAPESIIVLDLTSLKFTKINLNASKLFKYSQEEFSKKGIVDISPVFQPDGRKSIEISAEYIEKVKLGERLTFEWLYCDADAEEIICEVHLALLPDASRPQMYASVININERKRAEDKIRKSEEQYRTLFEQNLAGFYQSTPQGKIINCNEAFAKMLKYKSAKDLLNINASELYYSSEERNGFIENLLVQKQLHNYAGVLKCKDDSALHFLENISVRQDPATGEQFFDGIIIDITERRLAELQLIESNERFINVSKATFDAVWDWNINTKELYVGGSFEELFGFNFPSNTTSFETWASHIHPEDKERVIRNRLDKISQQDESSWTDNYRYTRFNGSVADVQDRGILLRNNAGSYRMIGAMQDITKQKSDEAALQASEARQLGILASQTNYVIRTDLAGNYSYYNAKFYEDFGWLHSQTDLVGINCMASINTYHHQRVIDTVEKCFARLNEVIQVEIDKPAKNGGVKTTLWDFICLTDNQGKPTEIQCVGIDISERKKAQIAFIETLEEKNVILESIGDAFFAVDKNWIITYWNNQAEKLLGRLKEDIIGHNLWEVFYDRTDTQSFKKYHQSFYRKENIQFEDYYPATMKWHEISAYPSENGLSVYFKDITERKLAEEEILKINRLYRFTASINEMLLKVTDQATLFSEACRIAIDHGKFMMSWIGIVDEKTKKVIAVEHAGEESGYLSIIRSISVNDTKLGRGPAGTALREERFVFCNDIENDPKMAPWKKAALKRGYESTISLPIRKFGIVIGAHTFYAPVKNFFDESEIELLIEATNNVGFALEIFEKEKLRKAAEEEIVSLNTGLEEKVEKRTVELQQANIEMEAFSYSISHDLRAPLRGIIGFANILEEDYISQLDENAKRITGVIKKNTLKMGNLIDDLLEFSKIGRLEIRKSNVDINILVEEIMLEIGMITNVQPVTWIIPKLPPVKADLNTLKQVWINLLSNAVKYTSKNKHPVIEIGSVRGKNETQFFVKDNGVGFNTDYKEKLYRVFQRLHSPAEFEGTGVGLAIVEKIITKHGGRVWAESEVGKGACFYFSLPVE